MMKVVEIFMDILMLFISKFIIVVIIMPPKRKIEYIYQEHNIMIIQTKEEKKIGF